MRQRQLFRIPFIADKRGVSAIEFGFIMPIIIVMAIATLDLGQGIYRNMQVQNAAQMGANYAMARGFDKSLISGVVTGSTGFTSIKATPEPKQFCGCASGAGIDAIDCNSKCAGGANPGTYVTVSAEGTYNTLLPYPLLPSSYQLKAQTTVRSQ
jgi:Flp pilus assembly pilin Flp